MVVLPRDDLASRIAKVDAPVLLLDTCTILDVVRAPLLDQMGTHDIEAVHALIDRTTGSCPSVYFVIAEQVHREIQENIDTVETDTRSGIKRFMDRFAMVMKRMRALSPGELIPDDVDLESFIFPQKGRRIADKIVHKSSVLTDCNDEIKAAYNRVVRAIPPATRAKQSIKDCVIAESYLRLAATLHAGGFVRNMVFATSNTKDYQQGHSSLHPELRAEFRSACLEYSPSWSAARYELDR